ncbi:MAG: glutathione S-transferase [Gammaproteobacteria bacterium]
MNLTLYTSPGSGNCYKVELFLRLLRLPYEVRLVNLRQNEHLSAAFMARNRFGQIPVLVDGDEVLTDSHAILLYLAGRYAEYTSHAWAPLNSVCLARIVRWLSVSANEIQNGLALARAIKGLNWPSDYDQAVRMGYRILKIMDEHLACQEWLALKQATVADIACYPYIALAADGGIDTSSFTHVRRWQASVEALPGYWPMPPVPGWPAVPLVPPPPT